MLHNSLVLGGNRVLYDVQYALVDGIQYVRYVAQVSSKWKFGIYMKRYALLS